ncbi:MAG: chemotaxis protein CheA, partial [Deltaproteobacteria bacterium]|nr:chemotaxis protein CheA [Deltaproteobacteria bacterium]
MTTPTRSGSQAGMSEFLAEATELVDRLQQGLSELDQELKRGEVAPAQLNDVFRAAHSLKGLAGIFGVESLVALTHAFEELLHGLRLGKRQLTDTSLGAMYEVGEAFARTLANIRNNTEHDLKALGDLVERLKSLAGENAADGQTQLFKLGLPEGMLSVLTEYEEHRLAENVRNRVPLYLVRCIFGMDDFDRQLAAVAQCLASFGEQLCTLPGSDAPAGSIAFELLFATTAPEADWYAALPQAGGQIAVRAVERRVTPEAPAVVAATPQPAEGEAGGSPIGDSVRVDIRKLDELMNVVGELALVRGGLIRALADLRALAGSQRVAADLQKTEHVLDRHLSELQQGIMNVRMIPLRLVFDRLSRTVIRLSRETGKEVSFEVAGEETELDKVIIEQLSDPLMHLVRNSLDHGIEPVDVRLAHGKPAIGKVSVRAFPRGRHVVIEVADDGAGLDEVAVRRTVLERGLLDEERVGTLSRRELWNYIFQPGFSTRRDVTAVSGRGVGMDVVKTNISRLSGMIDVTTAPHVGTTFTITLPITLAIVQALIVQSGQRTFALPLSS